MCACIHIHISQKDHQHEYAHIAAIRQRANPRNCSCSAEPERGIWWYVHGAVVRKEALQWRNGRYTWDAEEEDDSELDQCWRCFAADCPLGRYAAPEEIAASIAFLVGPESSFVTGAILSVDGGVKAR